MKFSAREDVDIPIARAFEMLTDFGAFERAARRRGADVARTDTLSDPGVGISWLVLFQMRGRAREVALTLTHYEPPGFLSVGGSSRGFTGRFDIELMALSRTRTRLKVKLDVSPKSIPARLMLQSLKLTRSSNVKRFKLRVAEYAHDMETRYNDGL